MTSEPTIRLSDVQRSGAEKAASGARAFLETLSYPLGVATIDHAWHGADAGPVLDALAAYQNDDGGFGRGLEVDIAAPASNPFAARLAMQILLALGGRSGGNMVDRLGEWLSTSQAPDGDWHFSDETRAGALAPWFAAWTFPSLNPACCIAGLATQLGIATPTLLERVAALFADKASIDQARTGEFYDVLPYAEYAAGVMHPDRDDYLDAIAANIQEKASAGAYGDPQHFFEHALGGGPDLVRRLPLGLYSEHVDRLLETQSADGGWPSPYSEAWRAWLTTESCGILARLRDGL
jgi:hypothetical protein